MEQDIYANGFRLAENTESTIYNDKSGKNDPTDSTNDFVNIIDDVDLYEQQYGSPSKDMVFNVSSEGYSDTSITTEQKDRNNLFR